MSAKEVDAILDKLPKDKRDTLAKLRKTIRAAAPKAEEALSYGLPAFRYKDKPLVSYSAAKEHCAFYVMSPAVMQANKADVKEYDTDKGTIRFPVGGQLPATLVKKLVKARMAETDAYWAQKGKKK
jgi:uncharacterized protein YdhG (YjbR/CyaY superfamily)